MRREIKAGDRVNNLASEHPTQVLRVHEIKPSHIVLIDELCETSLAFTDQVQHAPTGPDPRRSR